MPEKLKNSIFLCLILLFSTFSLYAEDGYNLWLRYEKIENKTLLQQYINLGKSISVIGNSPTIHAIRSELNLAFQCMTGEQPFIRNEYFPSSQIIIATPASSNLISSTIEKYVYVQLGDEGYCIIQKIIQKKKTILITANTDIGLLYGTFYFLELLQQQADISDLNIVSTPKFKLRMLNHWDNLDRTVERGYAGFSIWDWHKLPDYIDHRYTDYARANASIGINGSVLTNVNANAIVLTPQYLQKVAALADVFRAYGIKVYLTARFSAPIEIGGLKTADPLDAQVQDWWKQKANEIYKFIPDFGGFLVKANSEGQPGPQDYNRTHADGANMLADALAPFGGVVMWRAFVYSNEAPDDRAKQAYNELKPLDGNFRKNVLIQVKNGPIDFQPREPFHPLFGAMQQTPLMPELQITQEYTGCATHLFYEAPLFKELLESDTYANGKGTTVARIVDGSITNFDNSGIAGVANIGNDRNWCGHPFAQANWYAFGRLAWNHELSSEQIAQEWLKMTFSTNENFVKVASQMMIDSREALVNYMTPLGLHHIMARNHHYGPGPWVTGGRADWTSVYYHRADSIGLGFDRTTSGSNAVSQYFGPVADSFNNILKCPEKYLLWFHHVPWKQKLDSGRTLWEEMCYRYYSGANSVLEFQKDWESVKEFIDSEQFEYVATLLKIQHKEAIWWRDACVLYFQQFSGMPVPDGYEKPLHSLDYYQRLEHKFVPGIKND